MPPENSWGYARARLSRLWYAHACHELYGTLSGRSPGYPLVGPYLLGDLLANPVNRIQRTHRILKDHGDLRTPDMAQRALRSPDKLRALEIHLTVEAASFRVCV